MCNGRGRKLFLRQEVLVRIDQSLPPDGSGTNWLGLWMKKCMTCIFYPSYLIFGIAFWSKQSQQRHLGYLFQLWGLSRPAERYKILTTFANCHEISSWFDIIVILWIYTKLCVKKHWLFSELLMVESYLLGKKISETRTLPTYQVFKAKDRNLT